MRPELEAAGTNSHLGRGCGRSGLRLGSIRPEDVHPEQAAHDAVDPDRWLESENPDTRLPEDARHWIEVYTELLAFKERAVATAHHSLGGMPEEEARVEIAQTDLTVMEAERDRLRRHLEFWKQRHLDLTTP